VSFEDKVIVCADCGAEFVHSAADQQRYAERGFTNEPKRCRQCREKRKTQGGGGGGRSGGGGGGGGAGGGRSGFGRPQRESYEVTCAECGAVTTVPFKPTSGRPVYCRDCYRSRGR
jgi:CxxC-x17-CxxC domain-containing protein